MSNTTDPERKERRIGDKMCCVWYEPGHKKLAIEALDKEESIYLEAVKTSQSSIRDLADELKHAHVSTCKRCGMRALKERRDRMRVFGGLFWTNSEPAPYRRCASCGNDQENIPLQDEELFRRSAELRMKRALQVKSKYEAGASRNLLPKTKEQEDDHQ